MSEQQPAGAEQAVGTAELGGNVLLKVSNLIKHFPITKGIFFRREVAAVQAVSDISFEGAL